MLIRGLFSFFVLLIANANAGAAEQFSAKNCESFLVPAAIDLAQSAKDQGTILEFVGRTRKFFGLAKSPQKTFKGYVVDIRRDTFGRTEIDILTDQKRVKVALRDIVEGSVRILPRPVPKLSEAQKKVVDLFRSAAKSYQRAKLLGGTAETVCFQMKKTPPSELVLHPGSDALVLGVRPSTDGQTYIFLIKETNEKYGDFDFYTLTLDQIDLTGFQPSPGLPVIYENL